MHATRKVKLKDLSENLTCHLCGGYFIDATTIIECLHSFCRSCIVQHLEKTEFCPQCDVQLHSSKPLSSIRSDQMLQEVVYKLVPGLFQNEMTHRRKYYKVNLEVKPKSQQDGGQVNESYITSDDMIHLSLEFETADKELRKSTKRYFQCPAAVSIAILKKLVQGKYDLKNTSCIEILYRERYLPDDFLLMDIAYKYSWSHNGSGPLQLYYRVNSVPTPPTFNYRSLFCNPTTEKSLPMSVVRKYQKSIAEERFVPLKKGNKGEKPISLKCPSGKPRGRPKRKPTISTTEEPLQLMAVQSKKIKLTKTEKTSRKSKPAKIEKQRQEEVPLEEMNQSLGTEVQLRISENGVISAKSISSGEEKIINPLPHQVMSSLPLSTSAFTGVSPPSPLGYLKKPVTTNGNYSQSQRCRTPSPVFTNVQNSPISLKTHKGDNVKTSVQTLTKITNGPEKLEKYQWKNTKVSGDEKSCFHSSDFPVVHTPLKVPTPSKWLHQPHVVNGNLKFTTTKASPVKDKLGFTTNLPSPKKPPKFFKSRISDMTNGGTNCHNDIAKDNDLNLRKSTSLKSSSTNLKVPVPKSRISPPAPSSFEHENVVKTFPPTTQGHQIIEKRQIENTTLTHPEPTHTHHHQHMSNHQFPSFGLHVDGNGNMNMGALPMHFVPSLPNSYCSLPFYPNPPNPFLANALAMTMNMNAFSGFPFTNTTPNSTPNNTSNGSYKQGNSKNSSLDLSTSSKKSKTQSYVQISPKKSPKIEIKTPKKGKDSPLPAYLSSASTCPSPTKIHPSLLSNPKLRKSPSPVKITSELKNVLPEPSLPSPVDVIASPTGETKPKTTHSNLVEMIMSDIDPNADRNFNLNRDTTTDASISSLEFTKVDMKDETSERLHSQDKMSTSGKDDETMCALELMAAAAVSENDKATPISTEARKECKDSEPPTPRVMATLMVSLDEGMEVSPPGLVATVSGKSPTTTINNNNIVTNSDPPETVVSSNIISSSTTTTTSA